MITQERLKEVLNYDPETGYFTWTVDPNFKTSFVGKMAGWVDHYNEGQNSYVKIMIDCHAYKAHRLAWLYMYGRMPSGHIDHLNHTGTDNRILNLRDVSQADNNRNASMRKDNKSGVVGVGREGSDWRAYIRHEGKQYALKRTKDFFEAVCARKSAEIKYGFHENHGRTVP